MRNTLRALAAALLVALAAGLAPAAPQHSEQRSEPWTKQQLELAARLPLQDGGRVKPLDTYASFALLRMNGMRSVKLPDGTKLTPIEWLLDVLFYPHQAATYPSFIVQDSAAVVEIGVSVEGKKKRDHYSFEELQPGIRRLFEKAREYEGIEEKMRSSTQQQVYMLAINIDEFMRLAQHADFARQDLPIGAGPELSKLFDSRETTTFSDVLAKLPELTALQTKLAADPARAADLKSVSDLLHSTADLTSGTDLLALIPPTGSVAAEPAWRSPADLVMSAFEKGQLAPAHVAMIASFEGAARSAGDSIEFTKHLAAFSSQAQALAVPRGEYEKVGLEVDYYKANLLGNGLVFFILAFLLASLSWLKPQSRWLYRLTFGSAVVAALLVSVAIVVRCVIRERPPVSTLYETVLFVTAVGTITALVAEAINRQRIALSAAAILGIIGVFIANGYETLDKRDTMPSLVAVLDTNFWLATHVTAITIGYSAGMVAALLANFYLIRKLLPWVKPNPGIARTLTRMVYGTLCFGLIFSVVGTILGGVWANESWGRFWGWDPKENGALLICLSQIVILHGRMGGYLREFGLHMAAAFGGTVIAFSWFGVNLLGVGLHSYGFTQGIHTALWSYYIAQWGLMALAGVQTWVERAKLNAAREALQSAPQGGRNAKGQTA